jgi:uncharacterized lipoprotein YddW (UPF0748 family)
LSINDWRRKNNDDLVQAIHKTIKDYNQQNNKNVVFGISPGGI